MRKRPIISVLLLTTLSCVLFLCFSDSRNTASARKARFYKVYRLDENEVLKHVAPPFIRERAYYYASAGSFSTDVHPNLYVPNSFIFHQDLSFFQWGSAGGSSRATEGVLQRIIRLAHLQRGVGGGKSWTVDSVLRTIIGLASYDFSRTHNSLDIELPGDWVIRPKAPIEEKLKALEKVIFEASKKTVRFEKRQVSQEAIVAWGVYQFEPLLDSDEKSIHLFSDTQLETGAGGNAQSGSKLLRELGDLANMPVVNRVVFEYFKPIPFYLHNSAILRNVDEPTRKAELLNLLLANITRQTGIEFSRKTVERDIWILTEYPKQ